MWPALLAISLAGAPRITEAQRRDLAKEVPAHLVGPLAALAAPLKAARAGSRPTVANVRARLKAMRALESTARQLVKQPRVELNWLHLALALAWADLANLEGELFVEGEGDGPVRDAVRAEAKQRADDAAELASDEYLSAGLDDVFEINELMVRIEALRACWTEHLLRIQASDAIDLKVTLSFSNYALSSIEFAPALPGPREQLGECMRTRIAGWRKSERGNVDSPPSGDGDMEIPLHFTTPESDSAISRPEGRSYGAGKADGGPAKK